MSRNHVVEIPSSYEAEIALAERSCDVMEDRLENGRLPKDAAPQGDVTALIDAVGELLDLDELESSGQSVSEKRLQELVDRLEAAIKRFSSWPSVPRALAISPLAEMLEAFEVEWIAADLLNLLPSPDELSPQEKVAIEPAIRKVVLLQTRITFANGNWSPDFETVLRFLRDMSREEPDDEELRQTLVRGVVFHAIHGREALVAETRRSLAAAEPLPSNLAAALAELAEEIAEKEIFTLSLHLVLADAIAAGLVPEEVPPLHVVAAAAIALVRCDEPDDEIDVRHMARYVRASPRRLEKLARLLLPVLDWTPPDDDGPAELRQQKRWRMASSEIQFMPARWLPDPGTERPPYTEEAARARLRELPDVVWLMPEPFEAVRFVAECFSYGGDAPDEMDAEVVTEIVELWQREQVAGNLFMDSGDEWDDDEFEDDDWDDEAT